MNDRDSSDKGRIPQQVADMLVVLIIIAVATTLSFLFGIFRTFSELGGPLGKWQIDEVFPVSLALVCAMIWYALRRWRETTQQISKRAQAERALKESEERYRTLVESSPNTIFIYGPGGRYRYINYAGANFIGQAPSFIIGKEPRAFFPEKVAKEMMEDTLEVFRKNKIIRREMAVPVDGEDHHFSRILAPICNDKGEVVSVMGIAHDITERKKFQKQLIHSEKMASLGSLAAGVSHEIKNPLATIIQGIEYLTPSVSSDEAALDSAKRIKRAALRANKIIEDLLNVSRQHPPEWKQSDISIVIEETLSFAENQFNFKNVKIIKQFASRLPQVKVDRDQMQQVFLNILLNAVDAMPSGGTITITLEQIEIPPGKEYLQITFTDTGYGVPKYAIQRVFDPFFSIKKERGVGLGLSISRGIIEAHNGTIRMESQVGKGTRVIVSLPIKAS